MQNMTHHPCQYKQHLCFDHPNCRPAEVTVWMRVLYQHNMHSCATASCNMYVLPASSTSLSRHDPYPGPLPRRTSMQAVSASRRSLCIITTCTR